MKIKSCASRVLEVPRITAYLGGNQVTDCVGFIGHGEGGGEQRSTNEEKRDRRDRGRSSARDQRTQFAARNVKDEERQKIWQRNECRLVRERRRRGL